MVQEGDYIRLRIVGTRVDASDIVSHTACVLCKVCVCV